MPVFLLLVLPVVTVVADEREPAPEPRPLTKVRAAGAVLAEVKVKDPKALKQAQAFVRGQDKWKHPYYWAAWVLWGLPR